jgi:predicted methyltransferase
MIVLSHFQAKVLLAGRQAGEARVEASPDLGLSQVQVEIETGGARFPDGTLLGWEAIEEICEAENNCFVIESDEPRKALIYSEYTERVYSLMPTQGAPTMLVSGIPMHRIKGIDPYGDTLEKIKTLKPMVGEVLDTATGLGYTAIEAAKSANHVVTVELDPTAVEIARLNPWSRDLLTNARITRLIGDSYDVVQELEAGRFSRVIHDPPAFSLAGELYSGEFYAQLYRVMKHGGRLFHYVGDPKSKSGHNVTQGVKRRLVEVGFRNVREQPRAFGVTAAK